MTTLTPQQRRALRAKAHHLHAVVSIGQHGLTPPVLREIDVALTAHALVKIRVHSDDRAARETMLAEIAEALHAAPVQHLGKLLIVWREPDEEEVEEAPAPARKVPPARPAARSEASRGATSVKAAQGEAKRRKPAGSAASAPAGARRTRVGGKEDVAGARTARGVKGSAAGTRSERGAKGGMAGVRTVRGAKGSVAVARTERGGKEGGKPRVGRTTTEGAPHRRVDPVSGRAQPVGSRRAPAVGGAKARARSAGPTPAVRGRAAVASTPTQGTPSRRRRRTA